MKVLVTGGAGFIGSHIVDSLAKSAHQVIVVDCLDPLSFQYPPTYLRKDVQYCFADLRYWTPDSRFDDIEAVIHLAALGGVGRAAQEPGNILTNNVGGTARLLDFARGWPRLQRFILASSFSVYGANYVYKVPSTGKLIGAHREKQDLEQGFFEVNDPATGEHAEIQPITEETPPNPLEYYGSSKYMQELCLRGFQACPVNILRFSSVYGDRLRLDDGEATIIARLAGWIRAGVQPKLFEDGLQIRDWVYVGDVVAVVQAILDGKEVPPVMNVCSGAPMTLLGACEILQKVIDVDCPPKVVGGYRPGDMRHCLGDCSRMDTLLGRKPLSFTEGAELAFGVLRGGAKEPCAVS